MTRVPDAMPESGAHSEAGCCSPSRGSADGATAANGAGAANGAHALIGSDDRFAYPDDGETTREVDISPFMIDSCAVSNAAFAEFVGATGHVTEAERFGWSFVFGGLLPEEFPDRRAVAAAPWWHQVHGADWRHSEGPQPAVHERADHPVVHVSFNDALSYCAWAGKRLPIEAEWEFAARGGLARAAFPWGNELEPSNQHNMNVWQGQFPNENSLADGYYGTCPVDAFPANGYGMYNVTGNVWEWTADWFDPAFQGRDCRTDPAGPPAGAHKVQKGGSYLCHASYCRRYRIAARQGNEPDSSTGNLGFRCVADVPAG